MKILLLGSTGSIGTSTCNCIRRFKEKFELVGLSANNNVNLLQKQIEEFDIFSVFIGSQSGYENAKKQLPSSVHIFHGETGLVDLVNNTDFDILVNALVGAVGFKPTVAALKKNKRVALANKESLVIGGDLITDLIARGQGELLPIDSEHSALLQCLNGEESSSVESLTITASGGPFRDKLAESFKNITREEALNHPTWVMGAKITIDSSTLINKGFEVIEAHHLFNLSYDKLNVLIHPQSVIHSMVTFHDGAVMAQCGVPDMELPIQYALTFPKRLPIMGERLDLAAYGSLTFYEPDFELFPCLRYCIEAGKKGGTITTVLNAANEIAVNSFLNGDITYLQIGELIDAALNRHDNKKADSIEIIEDVDRNTRNLIVQLIKTKISGSS